MKAITARRRRNKLNVRKNDKYYNKSRREIIFVLKLSDNKSISESIRAITRFLCSSNFVADSIVRRHSTSFCYRLTLITSLSDDKIILLLMKLRDDLKLIKYASLECRG